MLPCRTTPSMLTRRSTLIVPPPGPLPPDTMWIHGWSGTAVHVQPAPAVIVMSLCRSAGRGERQRSRRGIVGASVRLADGEGLTPDDDAGVARWPGIGCDREIDRRRPGSARRYAGDPRRHAAARPATRRRRVDVERARPARRRRVVAGRIQRVAARGRGLRDREGLTADGDVGSCAEWDRYWRQR